MSMLEDLLTLYASDEVDKVHRSTAYETCCEQHEKDPIFNQQRQAVELTRTRIDAELKEAKPASHQQQVAALLKLIQALRSLEKQQMCAALAVRSNHAGTWSASQRDYFEINARLLMDSKHYFLSFTGRNPDEDAVNLVNVNHEYFIRSALGKECYESANNRTNNLLAKAVDHLLRSDQVVDGFFYPRSLGDNKIVESTLRDYCERCRAFVQLVQRSIFHFEDHLTNWCFFEYQEVAPKGPERLIFVQIEEKIDLPSVPFDYRDWYETVTRKNRIVLEYTQTNDAVVIAKNKKEIAKLVADILEVWQRIFDGVPAD